VREQPSNSAYEVRLEVRIGWRRFDRLGNVPGEPERQTVGLMIDQAR